MRQNQRWRKAAAFLLILAAFLFGGCGGTAGSAAARLGDTVGRIEKLLGTGEALEVESVSEGRYAYETLDENGKKIYDEIVYAIQNRAQNVQIATNDIAEMEKAYLAVRCDYCDLFWLDQFSYASYRRGDEITAIEITPTYKMTKEEQASIQAQIDAEADRMLADAPVDGSDYDKALYVYETLITEVDYVEEAEESQNLISVFLNHETVCQGYAYATQYLLEKLGIPCTTIEGMANGENHAWNLVRMDGEYYYIDTTWGNSQYMYRAGENQDTGETGKYIDYDYFGASTETMMASHSADPRIVLPKCTATEDNYYVHEGRYVRAWDAAAIGGMIAKAYNDGETMVQIKFSEMELYEQAQQYFVEEFHIADYCPDVDTIHYMEGADNCVLFLEFPSGEAS